MPGMDEDDDEEDDAHAEDVDLAAVVLLALLDLVLQGDAAVEEHLGDRLEAHERALVQRGVAVGVGRRRRRADGGLFELPTRVGAAGG